MTVLHSGTSKKFSENWGNAFGVAKSAKKGAAPKKKPAKALAKKPLAKKAPAKKGAKKAK